MKQLRSFFWDKVPSPALARRAPFLYVSPPMKIPTFILSWFCLMSSALGRTSLVEGGLYSTRKEDGSYSVLKILKLDPSGVHVRLYSNQFSEHPSQLDEKSLYIAGITRKPNESLGMGHAPISRRSFSTWGARFIKVVSVAADELEGYNMWKEAEGGYF